MSPFLTKASIGHIMVVIINMDVRIIVVMLKVSLWRFTIVPAHPTWNSKTSWPISSGGRAGGFSDNGLSAT